MNTRLLPLCALTMALSAIPTANAADSAPTYTINLAPANKVGTKFTLAVDASDKQQNSLLLTIPGAPAPQSQNQNEEVVAHLEGTAEVLAIYPNGSIQKIAITVKTLQATLNGQTMPGLPAAGAKIIGERTPTSKSYTVDGQPAPASTAKVLGIVFEFGDEKRTDQDVFGPKNPVTVGASWPVNSESMIAGLKEEMGAEISGASGTMKLESIAGSGDDQVATVSGNFSLSGVKPPMPPGMTIDSATMAGNISGSVPATTKGVENQTMSMSVEPATVQKSKLTLRKTKKRPRC